MMKNLIEFEREQKELIPMFHAIQEKYGYIPPEEISKVSKYLGISESEIFGILTFYKAFNLQPRGRHIITVCLGTACHVRGAQRILEEIERNLKINSGQTTPDKRFSLTTVNCLGCCAIGPVIVIDGKYYSRVTIGKIEEILKKYKESG